VHLPYLGEDVQVLGLNSGGDSPPDLVAFLEAAQVTFPILKDAYSVYNMYTRSGATSPYPLDYVIDRAGRVAYFNTEYDPDAITAAVDSLLQDTTSVAPAWGGGLRLSQLTYGAPGGVSLRLTLPAEGVVELDLFDMRGRHVRRLVTGETLNEGSHVRPWDGLDASGRPTPAGVYLARLRLGETVATSKVYYLR